MALNCENIENVRIGNNYGGMLYDLKIDVNFNSSTVFMASFVSENGTYSISPESLNSETPTTLKIGTGSTFKVYPVNYKIQSSPSGRLLVVKFVDASHIYLDKYLVTFKDIEGKRIIPIIPTSADKENNEVEFGKYTPAELLEKLGEIPKTGRVISTLKSFKKELKKGFSNDVRIPVLNTVTGLFLDTTGSLRDVLNDLGSKIGKTFFWDWSSDGVGKLDVIESTSIQTAINFANSIRSANEKYISNYEESYSIEDNYSMFDFVYDTATQKTESDTIRLIGRKTVGFKYLDIRKEDFWIKPGWEREYLKIEDMEKQDWLKLCAASLAGEELFYKYIYWNIAAEAARKFFRIPKIGSSNREDGGEELTSGLPVYEIDDKKRNRLIIDLLKDYYEAAIIFHRRAGFRIKDEMQTAENLNYLNRKEMMANVRGKGDKERPEILSMYGEKSSRLWCVAIKKKSKRSKDEDDSKEESATDEGDGTLGTFDDILKTLYNTCQVFAFYFNRYYISVDRRIKLDKRRDTEYYKYVTIQRRAYDNYNMNETLWIYEKDDASANEPFSGLVEYIKTPHFSETWKAEDKKQKPSIEKFIENFKLSDDAKPYEEKLEFKEDDTPNNIDEEEHGKLWGYVVYDVSPKRKMEIKDDLAKYNIPQEEGSSLDMELSVNKAQAYIINCDSRIEEILDMAVKKFYEDDDKKPLNPYIQRRYRKITDIESMPISSFDWRYIGEGQSLKNPKTMSNVFSVEKVPEVTEEYLFDIEEWMKIIKENKWPNGDDFAPAPAFTITIEKLVPMEPGWILSGLESYSLSYQGSSGVTTTITIGSRKKQRQSMENQERLIRVAVGSGLGITRAYMPRPSAAKASINYGMKAFS